MSTQFRTIRALTQSIEFFQQGKTLRWIFEDMGEVWLSLYTKDKKCPIVEQQGTNVKRNLVRRYASEFIKHVRYCEGLDIISKTISKDGEFWIADDIIQRISDNPTENHEDLFRTLLSSLFGLSEELFTFMFKEEKTKGELYAILKRFYDIVVVDIEEDDLISLEDVTEALSVYIKEGDTTLFKIAEY